MGEILNVYLHANRVGRIAPNRTDSRQVRFETASDYTGAPNALSEGFSLLAGGRIDDRHISRFLGGYLPEGPNRSQLAARIPGLNGQDLFGMLRTYGVTTAGALSVRSDDPAEDLSPGYRPLSDRDLVKKLAKAVKSHDLGNEPGSGRSALTGFQPKVLLARFDGQWHQPLRSGHSTHIVKPAPTHRPALIADEFYSHELTRAMGLSRFGSELVTLGGSQHLVIERYDRTIRAAGVVDATHQEDAAQALGIDWVESTAKFQDKDLPNRADRPTAQRIAELFGSLADDSTETWLRYLLFTVLVGNHDGHAKNVSLLHDPDGTEIAELYDAVPILHINDDPKLANSSRVADTLSLAIGGEFSHHAVKVSHFEEEVAGWDVLSERRAAAVIADTLDQFSSALDSVEVPAGSTPQLRDRLGYNLDRLTVGKSIGRPKLSVSPRQPFWDPSAPDEDSTAPVMQPRSPKGA